MKKETDPIRLQLDALMELIRTRQVAIEAMQKTMTARIEEITAECKPAIEAAVANVECLAADLVGLMKLHKAALFGERDRVDLQNGALLRQVQRKVKRIKKMLARLKETGHTEAIKTVESVDWDQIEKWEDGILKELGTKRVPKEIFAYEVKGV